MLPLAPPVPKVLQLSPGPSAVLLGAGFLPASSLAGQTAANLPATLLSVTKLKVPRKDIRPHKFNKVGAPPVPFTSSHGSPNPSTHQLGRGERENQVRCQGQNAHVTSNHYTDETHSADTEDEGFF